MLARVMCNAAWVWIELAEVMTRRRLVSSSPLPEPLRPPTSCLKYSFIGINGSKGLAEMRPERGWEVAGFTGSRHEAFPRMR
jgi:hypothetical protein